MKRRIVITGMGVVSPVGIGLEDYWAGLSSGHSGIRKIQQFDATGFKTEIAGEVPDFDPKPFLKQRKALKVMARDIQLAVAAAALATRDAGLPESVPEPLRFGVSIGAGFMSSELDELGVAVVSASDENGKFDMKRFGTEGMARLFPLWLLKYLPNMLACHISIVHNAQGPSNTITTASAAASQAIGEGCYVIERGAADMMIAGGAGSKINPISLVRYTLLDILSTRNDEPQKAVRPFDADRDGIVLGEGAGLVLLEEMEHAKARGAKIYAEVAGYASSCDAATMRELPVENTARADAMAAAVRRAGLEPEDIDLICSHGTGSVKNDRAEVAAIKAAFGDHAAKVPVTSFKPMLGYLGAGTGGVETIGCVLAMKNSLIPPLLNCDKPDEGFDLDFVRDGPRKAEVKTVLLNTSSLAGQNASLVLKRWED